MNRPEPCEEGWKLWGLDDGTTAEWQQIWEKHIANCPQCKKADNDLGRSAKLILKRLMDRLP